MSSPVVEVRKLRLGEGMPKICVPVMGRDAKEVISSAKQALQAPLDLAEWRVDFYHEALRRESVEGVLKELRYVLGETPLLFTFRTRREGGAASVPLEEYVKLNLYAAESRLPDLIDLELFSDLDQIEKLLLQIHGFGIKVILSNHDFEKTPEQGELVRRLCRMQEAGADIAKIAVMPQSSKDVLTLLEATEEMKTRHAKIPLVTMSMSALGTISRLCGETFGSAVTFGSAGQGSAPGQVEAKELKQILLMLHG